jgi:hypothetical protein
LHKNAQLCTTFYRQKESLLKIGKSELRHRIFGKIP